MTITLRLFHIIYIERAASKFGKTKPNRQYCLEIGKQKNTLKFLKFVLNPKLRMTYICSLNLNMDKSIPNRFHHVICSPTFSEVKLSSRLNNQRTNGPINAHLISGPTVSTKTNNIGKVNPGSSFI